MDLYAAVHRLWRLRILVAVGVVFAVFVTYVTAYGLSFPPKHETIVFGAASTQVMVNLPSSPIVDAAGDVGVLSDRAQILTNLVASTPVREAIAQAAGLSPYEFALSVNLPFQG